MRGGKRKGAGRPRNTGAWGERTVPVRVPVSMVSVFKRWQAMLMARKATVINLQKQREGK